MFRKKPPSPFYVPEKTALALNRAKSDQRRVIAVGTTSCRTLEYVANQSGHLVPGAGRCDLFIYPGPIFIYPNRHC